MKTTCYTAGRFFWGAPVCLAGWLLRESAVYLAMAATAKGHGRRSESRCMAPIPLNPITYAKNLKCSSNRQKKGPCRVARVFC